ncbi:hypothetical protein [Diaphorobacter sp. ED-3]|uniref:hypothetical protein n=1 Tax=Diaphorobacter sp. ED-3 TaxID=3016636 RepID=UPI0022DE7648|nr:hypothetical protein [Diaphorobacter sp. ED-3]
MTTPAKLKFTIYQGATFRKRLMWKAPDGTPIDLSGCTARMQVRAEVESPTVLLSLTTENGGLTLGGAAGTVDLYVSDEDAGAITWDAGVWDLEIVHPSGEVTRLAQGSIAVSPEVTRD